MYSTLDPLSERHNICGQQSHQSDNNLPAVRLKEFTMAATTATGPLETFKGGRAWHKCDSPMILGEAPIYRASDSTLHWVDCLGEPPELRILKIDRATGDAVGDPRILPLEDSVTVALFRKNKPGSYICAYYQGVAFLDEATGKLEVVKEIIPTDQRDKLRFNDGGVDAKGRFWLAEIDRIAMAYGTNKLPESYGKPKGRLWRYDPDGSLHLMESGVICGNGLAWSSDNKTSTCGGPLRERNMLTIRSVLQRFRGDDGIRVRLRLGIRFHLEQATADRPEVNIWRARWNGS